MKIIHDGREIEFIIDYKKVKKIRLQIEADGVIRLTAPKNSDEETLVSIVKKHADLILERLRSREDAYRVDDKIFGEKFLLFGREYEVDLIEDADLKKTEVTLDKDMMRIRIKSSEKEYVKKEMIRFYKKTLRRHVMKRIASYQQKIKIKPKEIVVEESNTAWGSCSSQRRLMFNWKLAMAPVEVIDYIVVHEMCHLEHMNHSKSFWTLVGKIMPDYKQKSRWLGENAYNMTI